MIRIFKLQILCLKVLFLLPNLRDYCLKFFAIGDIGVVALLPIDLGLVFDVEDGGDVGFDGDVAVVADGFGIGENFAHMGFSFAGPAVDGFFSGCGGVLAVFDVDVDDVIAHGFPEIEGILPRKWLGGGAIELEDGISGVEHQFHAWHFFDESQGVCGGKSSPVHAVFVGRIDASIGETFDNFAHAAEALLLVLIFAPWFLGVGHDAHELGAKAMHAWDGALDFGESDIEVTGDFFAPVADQGTEFGDVNPCGVEGIGDLVEGLLRHFVQVNTIDATSAQMSPSELLCGLNLLGERAARFIGKSSELHEGKVLVRVLHGRHLRERNDRRH